jgi:hypothetical protein
MPTYVTAKGSVRRFCKPLEVRLRGRTPYGKWTCEDGTEYLFNRDYEPFLQRKNGEITSCDRTARIPWKEQEWFFHDGEAPWDTSKQAPLKKINLVLIEWGQTPISKKRE